MFVFAGFVWVVALLLAAAGSFARWRRGTDLVESSKSAKWSALLYAVLALWIVMALNKMA